MSRLSLFSLVLFAGVGCLAAACSSDDDTTPSGTAGTAAGGAAGKGGGTATAGKSGGTVVSGEGGEGGAADTLYNRLGGYSGIHTKIGEIVTAELADSDIASYFAPNLKDPSHSPQPGEIIDCFSILLSAVGGGPYTYPAKTASGYQCRSMKDAHSALHIGSDTFDHFVVIAGDVLMADNVDLDDVQTVGEALSGTSGDIVDKDAPKSGPCSVPACEVPSAAGAGGEAGSQ